jgi:hypothetical protein
MAQFSKLFLKPTTQQYSIKKFTLITDNDDDEN